MSARNASLEQVAASQNFDEAVRKIMAHCPEQAAQLADVLFLENLQLQRVLSDDPGVGESIAAQVRANRRLMEILITIT